MLTSELVSRSNIVYIHYTPAQGINTPKGNIYQETVFAQFQQSIGCLHLSSKKHNPHMAVEYLGLWMVTVICSVRCLADMLVVI